MIRHTRGPWIFGTFNAPDHGLMTGAGYIVCRALDGRAVRSKDQPQPGELDANFRLIAAAPTMLAALEAAADQMAADMAEGDEDPPEALVAVRAAIREARG